MNPHAMPVTLFLAGDVMTGRGIDQILAYPSAPRIYEPYVSDARVYAELAERVSGPVPRAAGLDYIWGDALRDLERHHPVLRLINLETAITGSSDFWPDKQINYRMNPSNAPVLVSAGVTVASLANNHVLDWGYAGLQETIDTLRELKIQAAGAGRNATEAQAPALVEPEGGCRILVFSFAAGSSGVPHGWAASNERPGVHLLPDLSAVTVGGIRSLIEKEKRPGNIVIASIHWGGNWGYGISAEEEAFARGLIEEAGADLIHGHSSHHLKRIDVYRGKLILYGCGDLLNDYEGIGGHEHYRPDLGLMYYPRIDPGSGRLLSLEMTPTRIRRFRINLASEAETRWIQESLNREGISSGTRVVIDEGRLRLIWKEN